MQTNITLTTVPAMAFFLIFSSAFGFTDDKKKTTARASVETESEVCLEVSGNLDPAMKSNEGTYTVKLIQDNQVIEQMMVDSKQKFKLDLKRNAAYTIRIEKEGFIPRLVSVNTNMPESARKTNLYRFHFDMQLFSESYSKYFDPDDIDFPIALIAFDTNKRLFHYDKKYTAHIQEKMHNMSSTAGKN